MKKIPLLLLSFLSVAVGFAQSYTISNRNSQLAGSASEPYIEAIITITNTSNVDTQFTWTKLDQTIQSGWNAQFCDPFTCFDPIPASSTFLLKKGKSAIMSFKITPNGKGGTGKFSIGLSLLGSSMYDTINFSANFWSLGVSNNLSKMPELSVYPNPTQSEININYDSKYVYQVDIVNIIGSRMKSFSNLEGHTKIDISDLPDGVYIVKINDRGRILTRRITKS